MATRQMLAVSTFYLAERVGFEPTVPLSTLDFESSTIDHSDTSPY